MLPSPPLSASRPLLQEKPKEYFGLNKYEIILQLKKYNAAHKEADKLPIPPLSLKSQLKVATLESQEKKRLEVFNAKKEATRLIEELITINESLNGDSNYIECDWDNISEKCKSLMRILKKKKSDKWGDSRDELKEEHGKEELTAMIVETELLNTLTAAIASFEEEKEDDDAKGNNNMELEAVQAIIKIKSESVAVVENKKDLKASTSLIEDSVGLGSDVKTQVKNDAEMDKTSHHQARSKTTSQNISQLKEQTVAIFEAAASSVLLNSAASSISSNNQHRNRLGTEEMEPRQIDQWRKDIEISLTPKQFSERERNRQRETEKQNQLKKQRARERFQKEYEADKEHFKKQQELKEKRRREKQLAQSMMWREEREKARLKKEAVRKEQERLEKEEMARGRYHGRSRSGPKEEVDSTRLFHPVNYLPPTRRSRSSEPKGGNNNPEFRFLLPVNADPKVRHYSAGSIGLESGFPQDFHVDHKRTHHPLDELDHKIRQSSLGDVGFELRHHKEGDAHPKPRYSIMKLRPASPEVHFTPSTKGENHDDKSKDCTRFPKWLSKDPKRCPIVGRYTEEEKAKELKRRQDIAEKLHHEVKNQR